MRVRFPGILSAKWGRMGFALRPSPGECRRLLAALEARLGRRGTALALCVPVLTLEGWKAGRGLSSAAIRAIWLVHALILRPARLQSILSLATWGRFEEQRERRTAPPPVPDDWCI